MGLPLVVITPCGFETLDIVVAARFSSSRVARWAICVRALVATSSAEAGSVWAAELLVITPFVCSATWWSVGLKVNTRYEKGWSRELILKKSIIEGELETFQHLFNLTWSDFKVADSVLHGAKIVTCPKLSRCRIHTAAAPWHTSVCISSRNSLTDTYLTSGCSVAVLL